MLQQGSAIPLVHFRNGANAPRLVLAIASYIIGLGAWAENCLWASQIQLGGRESGTGQGMGDSGRVVGQSREVVGQGHGF